MPLHIPACMSVHPHQCVFLYLCVGVCVAAPCVCVCDLSGQVTGIRVRGEDDWLQGDDKIIFYPCFLVCICVSL